MARVCIDDDIEGRSEFWRLIAFTKGNRDEAMGRLVRFFRLAQDAYAKDLPVTRERLLEEDLEMMIDTRWAVPVDGGFQAAGAEKYFGWLKQRTQAGKKRSETGTRSASGSYKQSETKEEIVKTEASALPAAASGSLAEPRKTLADDQRQPAADQPLALAPAPALVSKQIQESLNFCIAELQKTYAHFGIQRDAKSDELNLLRFLTNRTRPILPEDLCDAIIGFRFEEAHAGFRPEKNFRLSRLNKPEIFEKLRNLGSQNRSATQAKWRQSSDAV